MHLRAVNKKMNLALDSTTLHSGSQCRQQTIFLETKLFNLSLTYSKSNTFQSNLVFIGHGMMVSKSHINPDVISEPDILCNIAPPRKYIPT